MNYNYARDKLFRAVEILSTSPGDVRSRINIAYHEFHPLREKHFPDELKSDWTWIIKSIGKFGPKLNYNNEISVGSVEHTLSRIKNKTGTKIAKKIFYLFYLLHHTDRYL